MNIAFIDDGIIENVWKEKINLIKLAVKNGVVIDDNSRDDRSHSHASTCVSIFLHHLSDEIKHELQIFSIKILYENSWGTLKDLTASLNWAFERGIKIINISAGSIYYKHSIELRNCINMLALHGVIIIAANSNNDLFTYPASFSNVLGVRALSNSLCSVEINSNYKYDGIEFCASAIHDLPIYENEH